MCRCYNFIACDLLPNANMFLESNIPFFDLMIIDYNYYYMLVHDFLTTPTAAGLKTRLLSMNPTFMTCPIAPASLVGSGHSQKASIISRLKTSPLSMILLFPKLHRSEHRPKHGLNCRKHPTRIRQNFNGKVFSGLDVSFGNGRCDLVFGQRSQE